MIKIVDDFAPDFDKKLSDALEASYTDVVYAGHKYPSLSTGVSAWAYPLFEKHLGFKVTPVFDYLRKYEKDIQQPSYIHEDSGISKYTAVLSMRDNNGGIAFWEKYGKHFQMGENYQFIKNRCVIYDAEILHSRIPENWDQDEPRLVHVFFFNEDKGK